MDGIGGLDVTLDELSDLYLTHLAEFPTTTTLRLSFDKVRSNNGLQKLGGYAKVAES